MNKQQIIELLNATGKKRTLLFEEAAKIKNKYVGNTVYLRGLIEFSNICNKDCLYCGIRKSNSNTERYNLTDAEILTAVTFAHEQNYGSVVLQSGEISGIFFTERIENLLQQIKIQTNNEIGITLSLGEQSEETYRRWFNAGAHRYLLRVESSNEKLYAKIHPNDQNHLFANRLNALKTLKNIGYQTGTGVMIGLPFQTIDHLADDLLFMHTTDIDMCGMGPYIEHEQTPLNGTKNAFSLSERFDLSLKMIAILRLLMPNINIAATTALQAIDPLGREKAIKAGANIIMPNITPGKYRNSYKLYNNKPCTDEDADTCNTCIEARISLTGNNIGYGKWGDSKHFKNKNHIKT